jgi:hypothetical protein
LIGRILTTNNKNLLITRTLKIDAEEEDEEGKKKKKK